MPWSAGGGGTGSVTSVALTAPGIFSVAGSPVTSAGTLALSLVSQSANLLFASPNGSSGTPTFRSIVGADFGSQTANFVFAAPNGSTGNPTFRALVSADLPAGLGSVTSVGLALPAIFTISGSPVTTSGTLTGTLASQSANLVWASPNGSSGTPTFRSLVLTDVAAAFNWTYQNTAFTAANGGAYLCDTSSASFTVTAPTASTGVYFTVADGTNSATGFTQHPLTVSFGSGNIVRQDGTTATSVTISTNGLSATFAYNGANWKFVAGN